MIKIQKEDIDIVKCLDSVRTSDSGGIVTFLGTVRNFAKGRSVISMNIEIFEEMAIKQLEQIHREAKQKYGVNEVSIIHRYGDLTVMDNIVFIAVSSKHRREAFNACMYIIDELKQRVPIWKKETTPEGDCWVEGEGIEKRHN